MQQRNSNYDKTLDDFPTPPWATRAFLEHLSDTLGVSISGKSVLEPCANRGYMAEVLKEYGANVTSRDVMDYGYPLDNMQDFLCPLSPVGRYNMIITNPPFKKAAQFIEKGLRHSPIVCVLLRTSFLEGKGRYAELFSCNPPTAVYQYVERVPMVQGRLDQNASSATSYAWFVFERSPCQPVINPKPSTQLFWIPPGRKQFEKGSDYE